MVIEFTNEEVEAEPQKDKVLLEVIKITESVEKVRTVTLDGLLRDVENAKDEVDKCTAELLKREALLAEVIEVLNIQE